MSTPKEIDLNQFRPLEVKITRSVDEAIRIFRSLVQKEGVLNIVKQRRAYEKPSEKKRRKIRESQNKKFLSKKFEEQIANGEYDKIQKKKALKREQFLAKNKNTTKEENV